MNFTCNPVKNETNIRERGLPLLAARVMFNPAMRVREDTRKVTSVRHIWIEKAGKPIQEPFSGGS